MSYYIYDTNGYVGDLASGGGLSDLKKYIQSIETTDIVNKLIDNGYVPKTDELLSDLNKITKPKDSDILDTLNNLISLSRRCDEIVIITDGIFDAE